MDSTRTLLSLSTPSSKIAASNRLLANLCRYSSVYVLAGSPLSSYEMLRPSASVTNGAVCTMGTPSSGNASSAATAAATTAAWTVRKVKIQLDIGA
jgi:hypothetical protein